MRLVSAIYNDFYPFDSLQLFNEFHGTSNPNDLKEGDCLVVWGGEDISPALYNKPVAKETGAGDRPSRRDTIEWALMNKAKELKIPIIGICRGAQMLCALAGGHLIQDVTNHATWDGHDVETHDGFTIEVNSIHHQMMYPFNVKHEILAKSPWKRSKHYVDGFDKVDVPLEPEFVYFPEVKGFAIQWHPEMMDAKCDATSFIFEEVYGRLG